MSERQTLYVLTYTWNLKTKLLEQNGRCQRLAEDDMDEGGQKVQTSSYKRNKSQRCNVQHSNYS